jgi:hypothetical protein
MYVIGQVFVGGTIAKLPHSWRYIATSLKHKKHEFYVIDLIWSLDVKEKVRAKTHMLEVLREVLEPTWYRKNF